jgi:hypothetical protein
MENECISRVRLLAAANRLAKRLAKPPFILHTAGTAGRQSKSKP